MWNPNRRTLYFSFCQKRKTEVFEFEFECACENQKDEKVYQIILCDDAIHTIVAAMTRIKKNTAVLPNYLRENIRDENDKYGNTTKYYSESFK